jgi:RHS repeat-associated protein
MTYVPSCMTRFVACASRYTGKERDQESGLDYFGARYYGSSMGRFMSPDPINLTEERLLNPSNTLNKYAYGANNPLKYVDDDGKDITIFYEAPGLSSHAGHIMFLATDQQSGDAAE